MDLVVIATEDEFENDPSSGLRCPNPEKLPAIYRELRGEVFIGEPLQENQGDNGIVFRSEYGPNGNYGWQLFRTRGGTAMLEYRGPVSYWPHERKPRSIEQENGLRELEITFHQQESSIATAREIVRKYTKTLPVSVA